jgi:hypothetical protein
MDRMDASNPLTGCLLQNCSKRLVMCRDPVNN